MSNLTNVAIGIIVVRLLLVRQLQPRPAKESSSIRVVLILAAAGVAEITRTAGTHHLSTAGVAWLAASLMSGAGLGAIRAATIIYLARAGRISLAAGNHPHRRLVADLPDRPPGPRWDH